MTGSSWSERRTSFAAAALSAAFLVSAGGLHAAGLSCTGLSAAGAVTSNPISCTVNCSAGGKLSSAIALKPRTTSSLTITVNGTCVESNDHVPGGITIQGASSSATLQAPSKTTDPVLGIGGGGVTLSKLTISGGLNGLRVRSTAGVTGNNLVIEKASNADVLITHGSLTLNASTIENSTGNGIDVDWGGVLFINGGTVQQNRGWGVSAFANGSIDLFGNVVVQKNTLGGGIADHGGSIGLFGGTVRNNTGPGLEAANSANLRIDGSTAAVSVTNNGSNGVVAFQSEAFIGNGANIAGNSGNGIFIYDGGTGVLFGGGIVQSNAGDGIHVESGNIQVGGGTAGGATVKSNGGNGIYLQTNSVGSFASSSNRIVSNKGFGIFCANPPGDPLITGVVGTVSGNAKGQNNCKVAGN